jgi:sugar lactone lactonase YvrE
MYGSKRVMVFSSEGRHLKDIIFSAQNLACTTWGGKNHDIIYVASAKDQSAKARSDDEGGCMFRFKPRDARGQAKYEFAG